MLHKLPVRIQLAVLEKLERLGEDPRPPECDRVRGLTRYHVYRVTVARDYRVLYQVRDEVACVLVVKIADRKEVYRRLDDLKPLLG